MPLFDHVVHSGRVGPRANMGEIFSEVSQVANGVEFLDGVHNDVWCQMICLLWEHSCCILAIPLVVRNGNIVGVRVYIALIVGLYDVFLY